MSKLDQIQTALMSIDQGNFQKLCDSYLHRILDIKEINSVGSVAGEAKTRTGQPDTLITLNNGNYVFVEATTEKSGLLAKFSADLDECFDESKTGVSLVEVEKIILACNRKLSQKDKTALIKKGQDKDCIVEFLDLDTVSFDLYQKFQPLAKDFLGIELDTGQILKPLDFVTDYQNSKFATPLDNDFLFRETEKKQVLEALEKQDLVIISGKPGVGKSKLALEALNEFVDFNAEFQPFCIINKKLDLYENLKAYFGADGKYLIVVDDANRLTQLPHILRLINEQTDTRKIKIVLTVRDYALNQVRNETKHYASTEIELQKFSSEEIEKILESFEIRNHDYIDRIYKISGGNPRLAIMMAKVALEKNTLDSINDVSDLYDIYFDSINEDLKELGNEDLLQIAGIISFFRVLDRTNTEVFESIAQLFSLTVGELWTGLEKLHDLEIVDLDYEVAKISDQILGTYLFYKAFFKEEVLDFSLLLSDFSERYSYRLVDSLNPVLNTFNTKLIMEKLRPHIDKRWREIKDDETKALAFMKLFHYLKETEFLLYLKNQIDSIKPIEVKESELKFIPRNYEPVNDKYLEVIKLFQSENIELALDLMFSYLEKNLNLLPQVIQLLTRDFCFNHYSYKWNYYIQQNVISKLIEKSKGEHADLYQKILLQVSGTYSQMIFNSDSSNGRTVTIYKSQLKPTEAMIGIREVLWQRLIEIYHEGNYQKEVFSIIQKYNRNWHKDFIVKAIIEKDVEILLPFIKSLNAESYQDCVLAQSFFDFLEHVEVDFDKSLKNEFTNKTYEISEVLLNNDRREFKLGFDEYEKHKKELLESHFKSYEFENYQKLFEYCEEIQSHLEEREVYPLHFSLAKVLINLSETDKELFIKVINRLFESGNKLYLSGDYVIHKFVEKSLSPIDAYENIKESDFNVRNNWLFGFFQSLTDKSTNEYFLNELYALYRSADLKEIPQRLDYLENCLHLDNDVFSKVIRILFERVQSGEGYFNFHFLFNSHGEAFKKLDEIFAKEISLIKEIYLHQNKIERYHDYKSEALKKIFLIDNNFLFEYSDFLIEEKTSYELLHDGNTHFTFIWDQSNYKEIFISLLDFIYQKEEEKQHFWNPSFIELVFRNFIIEEKDEEKLEAIEKQKVKAIDLLKILLKENAKDKRKASCIFQLVVNFFGDKKKEFLEVFLAENRDVEDFEWLPFETNHVLMADMGSRIPTYEHKIKFYESLLPLFNSIYLLEHKLIIEEKINRYKQNIEDAKKSDFIGHY